KNNNKPIQKNFTNKAEKNKKIYQCFDSLHAKGHSAYIRKAIKDYIHQRNNGEIKDEIGKVYKKLTTIEESLKVFISGDASVEHNDRQDNEGYPGDQEYIDAEKILKNLGK